MAKDDEKPEEEKKGGKGKLIIILVAVLAIAGGAYFFVLKPKDSAEATTKLPEPVPGAVVTLDSITINLAGGHFLKLGLALQPTASAGEEVSGSKALDLAIDEFSNMSIDDLSTTAGRREAKDELIARIKLTYLPEGTTLADATGAKSDSKDSHADSESSDSESSDSESADSESSSDEADSGGGGTSEETSVTELSATEAKKLAAKLTVQPLVYDVYFTEFVMQ
ncbi:flagellar basal body-associated protein FliL [Spongisporangium articulatum]|uniref:Flagellar protein FliL n=1 Tax=Spongisporangium articulatum TaxID=3362603 RepID=A0ABW8AHN6_9ACTN